MGSPRFNSVVFLSGVLALFVAGIVARNPGVGVRVTTAALEKVIKTGFEAFAPTVIGTELPGQSGEIKSAVANIKYKVEGLTITSFVAADSVGIDTVQGQSLTLILKGISTSVKGNWEYSTRVIFPISDNGKFTCKVTDISVQVTVKMGKDSAGRITIQYTKSSAKVGDVDLDLVGAGPDWIIDAVKGQVEDKIKEQLSDMVGVQIKEIINGQLSDALNNLDLVLPIGDALELDLTLTSDPSNGASYIQAEHKGAFYLNGDRSEPSFEAPELPQFAASNEMVQIVLSNYSFNSLGNAIYATDELKYTLTADQLPEGFKKYLYTSCTEIACIGSLVPQLPASYPDKYVEIDISLNQRPRVTVNNNALTVNLNGDFEFYIDEENVFTVGAAVSTSLSGELEMPILKGEIKKFNLVLSQESSIVGDIDVEGMTEQAQAIVTAFILPIINDIITSGVEIPDIGPIRLVDTQLISIKDGIMVSSSFMLV